MKNRKTNRDRTNQHKVYNFTFTIKRHQLVFFRQGAMTIQNDNDDTQIDFFCDMFI